MIKMSLCKSFIVITSNSHDKNQFFESPPTASFQKTDFGVSIAFGNRNTKIGMRIAA